MELKLRDHQKKALEHFNKYYYDDDNNRGILSMCCGSGKRFTLYSIIKNCILKKEEKLFIYITSRILLVQDIVSSIIKWIYYDKLQLDILVKVSEIQINKIEQSFKDNFEGNIKEALLFFDEYKKNVVLLTDESHIKDILISRHIHSNRNVLIISTYESSIKIVSSIVEYNRNEENEIVPDLLVLDQAHNLAHEDTIKTAKILLEKAKKIYLIH